MKYLLSGIGFLLSWYAVYMILVLIVDFRIEQLRKPINDNAIRVGAQAAVEEYKKIYTENETLLERKRKVRDKKLQEYADKLDRILSMPWNQAEI